MIMTLPLTTRLLHIGEINAARRVYVDNGLYALSPVLEEIKAAAGHIPGLKIAVMGCIVNGPGEMADADYGYVGAGPGLITLYRGREVVRRNVPQSEALEVLVELLKADGVWTAPKSQ